MQYLKDSIFIKAVVGGLDFDDVYLKPTTFLLVCGNTYIARTIK